MHWFTWYFSHSSKTLEPALRALLGTRYFSTPIHPKDDRRILNTLKYIHANPKAGGVRKGCIDPYSNFGHYNRFEGRRHQRMEPCLLKALGNAGWLYQAL